MTERLYYTDSTLLEFTAEVAEVRELGGRTAVLLNRSAFYPTSGGQVHDTGFLESGGLSLRVVEVTEDPDGEILHVIDAPHDLAPGATVKGMVDANRRRDHTQQHSGQHVLSAVFERSFGFRTVSFHMGDEACTIDLQTNTLTSDQVGEAEVEASRVVLENRPVAVRFASPEEAREMGVRKIPADVHDQLRLIDISGVDLTGCGGTHVSSTGEIGAILLRKTEKVRQGVRVEFVCGNRAVRTARRDYEALTSAAALYSSHIWDLPAQIGKSQEEFKEHLRSARRLQEELAAFHSAALLALAREGNGYGIVSVALPDRDAEYIKLLAKRLTAAGPVVALLGASAGAPAVVFAQTPGLPHDLGALMKRLLPQFGGRGGGTRDLAQGGVPDASALQALLDAAAESLS